MDTRRFIAAIAVVFLSLAAASAQGQVQTRSPADSSASGSSDSKDQEARHIFESGRIAYDAGRYRDALDYFQRAYKMSNRPQLLFNIGQAADRLRMDGVALNAFEQYLRELPGASNSEHVEKRMTALRLAIHRDAAGPQTHPDLKVRPAAADSDVDSTRVDESSGTGGVTTKWWFWTAIGVGVAAIVTAVAMTANDGDSVGDPTPGNTGLIVATLEAR